MNGQGHLIRAHETFEDLLKIKFHYQLQRLRIYKKGVFYTFFFIYNYLIF
jgi:hypothetical protein